MIAGQPEASVVAGAACSQQSAVSRAPRPKLSVAAWTQTQVQRLRLGGFIAFIGQSNCVASLRFILGYLLFWWLMRK